MSKKHTLLIIDDIVDNLMLLGEAMSSEYKIKVATSGVQGLELAVQNPKPDLILLDIMMPGIDGYEVCRRLKADSRTRHIPVIFLSALDKESDELQGLDAGAVDFITKPFKLEVVRARINTQLELLRMRQQLQTARLKAEAASQSKSVFLANMSHEIRTPMSAIMGMTDLALEKSFDPQQQSYLETVKLSADSLLALINDILDFSKIEAGQMELDEHPFLLAEAIEAAMRTVSILSKEKGLEITLEIAPDVPVAVAGDSLRFRQIILNLLSNAIKFSVKGVIRINVTVEHSELATTTLRVSVIDQGIGIKEDKISSVFSAFSQADSSVSRKFGGTGLGLAICRQLCELMGGTIRVESEYDKGSTFSFAVMFGVTSQEKILRKKSTNSEIMKICPIRVLLVEDNAANRFLIRVVLEKFKHEVIEAVDGIEALHIMLEDHFDLILSDVQMPKLDGYRLTKIIRACEEGKELDPDLSDKLDSDLISKLRQKLHGKHRLVISMTANAMSGDKEKCFTAGMDDYLTKPLNQEELAVTLTRWLPTK
ncbi:Response regulator receiver domain-containing protein [Candidatus Electrothrix aarhusensis]|jgi:signal transduction histidine kinase|uniref:Sensory/regulatory protein RpfC n=1 Tax=Candidatus Electrothrix aarhusensis TaxID=1859131 RepID=A0A444IRD3_9BACT|nr:Response regulator receiver domain-containing protein [Candidatus Electrothrix aarhusensis]